MINMCDLDKVALTQTWPSHFSPILLILLLTNTLPSADYGSRTDKLPGSHSNYQKQSTRGTQQKLMLHQIGFYSGSCETDVLVWSEKLNQPIISIAYT